MTYRNLTVWQRSMDLAEDLYDASAGFPSDERFGLTAQLRRCAVSIPSNIAEGYGRNSPKSFAYFLSVAMGSLKEAETQLLLAQRFGMIEVSKTNTILDNADEIGRMLLALIRKAERDAST